MLMEYLNKKSQIHPFIRSFSETQDDGGPRMIHMAFSISIEGCISPVPIGQDAFHHVNHFWPIFFKTSIDTSVEMLCSKFNSVNPETST